MFKDNQSFSQFLDDYYAIGPQGYLQYVGRVPSADLKKILIHTESNWYENVYAKEVQLQLSVFSEIYKLFDKKPITAVGDSYKYATAFGVETTAQGTTGTTVIFGTPTETTISTITGITSGIERVILNRSLHAMIKEKLPEATAGGTGWDFLRNNVANQALMNKIDQWLGGYEIASGVHGVDTPAAANIECVDRMISNTTESGQNTTHVSTLSDGNIYWDGAGSSAKIVRSDTDVTWTNAQITLPSTAGTEEAFDIMTELDDLMVLAKPYSKNKRYIGLTTGKTLNKIEAEVSPGYRYLEKTVNVAATINGISTRPGHDAGFDVGALVLSGVTVPVFTSEALPTKNSEYTDTTSGHFYLIDLDELFIRVDIPVTYLETGFGSEMLSVNYFQSRALLFTVAQLVCTKFQSHAALKWIKA